MVERLLASVRAEWPPLLCIKDDDAVLVPPCQVDAEQRPVRVVAHTQSLGSRGDAALASGAPRRGGGKRVRHRLTRPSSLTSVGLALRKSWNWRLCLLGTSRVVTRRSDRLGCHATIVFLPFSIVGFCKIGAPPLGLATGPPPGVENPADQLTMLFSIVSAVEVGFQMWMPLSPTEASRSPLQFQARSYILPTST